LEIARTQPEAADEVIAAALYVAVSSDTGCFAFGNTNADTFRAAYELTLAGAPIGFINRTLFREKTRARAVLEGLVFAELGFYFEGRAAIAVITRDMMARTGATEDDMDDIASLPGSVEGVRVGVTVRELARGECKVSMRSSPEVNSNELCARFGGGGHAMAAGFTSQAEVATVKAGIIGALGEIFAGESDDMGADDGNNKR
jgi:phosphoesterase RecJ-like protein